MKVREDFTITEKARTSASSKLTAPSSTFKFKTLLTPSCRWVDISTWTPTPQGCLYLGPSPSYLDNSFFAGSLLTSYNFLASLQIKHHSYN